jgi:hypothetical protein
MRLLKFALTRLRSERGQALVLAALAMLVILGFAAMAIDVGYWYSQKREVQKAVDAAALAGAQELPDNPAQAETVARDYLTRNGITDQDTISVTFRRISTYLDEGEWDAIAVEVERPAEAWFARVFGIQEALIRDVRAVGCRGSCGGSPFTPVDVVQIMDRTGSMTAEDMANAKDGARALLEFFNGEIQHVGLAVLGPSTSWVSPCGSAAPGVWLPVNLSDDFQHADGTLNEGSRLVSTINCLTTSSVGTDIGDPLAAAIDELETNGRPDVKWGIILLTDGAANQPVLDTGNRSPTANAAVASGSGDSNGFQTNPQNAYADDTSYAVDTDSGTNTNTGCGDSGKDRHVFYNYGISVPGTDTVTGIEVRLIARVDSTSSTTRRMCVQLSWDGGVTWTAAQQTNNLSTSYQTYTLGTTSPLWGRTWTPSQLSDANFRVRITNVANSTARDFYLDWAAVRVYYVRSGGPCQYAAEMGDAAKAAGIEVFTIGYGVGSGDPCSADVGAWADNDAVDVLSYIATDADHFFNQPTTEDLRPIFEVIGSQLSGGSVLVE